MKKLVLFLLLAMPALAFSQKAAKVEAYYFHYTHRCVTCNTVEAEAKKDLQELYPAMYKSGQITFQSLNLDEKSSDAVAEKLKVSGQTLLLVKGKKQVNITNEAFLYARSNPDKLKSIIKEKVSTLK